MGQFEKKNRLKMKNEGKKILGWKYFIHDALLKANVLPKF
jgi:hypothetical protein